MNYIHSDKVIAKRKKTLTLITRGFGNLNFGKSPPLPLLPRVNPHLCILKIKRKPFDGFLTMKLVISLHRMMDKET